MTSNKLAAHEPLISWRQYTLCRERICRLALRLLSGSMLGLCLTIPLSACESMASVAGGAGEKAVAGLTGGPSVKRPVAKPQTVAIQLNASMDMNSDEHGNGLVTVFRLYQLQDSISFMTLPYSAFLGIERERAALGNAVVSAREFILLPGQTIDFTESMADGATHLGVVALFRKRSGQRWRLAFLAADAARAGIVIGVHACAMTATKTTPLGTGAQEALLLSTAPCK